MQAGQLTAAHGRGSRASATAAVTATSAAVRGGGKADADEMAFTCSLGAHCSGVQLWMHTSNQELGNAWQSR